VNRRKEEVPSNPTAQPSAIADDKPEVERIRTTLEQCQWNRRKAAKALGMSYQTLRRRIEQYELDQRN
jgi:DNA-binding NtrC family response regulator